MSAQGPKPTSLWTPSQRRAIALLVLFLGIGLLLLAIRRPVFVPEERPPSGNYTHGDGEGLATDDCIDPNQADWQTLASLPSLGEKRAQQIVKYREQFLADHDRSSVAFKSADDLRQIKGIGPATISNLAPYLVFPATAPANRPARAP